MKDVVGSPGTWSGLALRVAQCASAAASLQCHRVLAPIDGLAADLEFLPYVCVDICSLWKKLDLHHSEAVWPIVIGNWFTAIGSLAAASASAGVLVLLERDTDLCRIALRWVPCGQDTPKVILAFMTWSFMAASAASSFWLLASVLE